LTTVAVSVIQADLVVITISVTLIELVCWGKVSVPVAGSCSVVETDTVATEVIAEEAETALVEVETEDKVVVVTAIVEVVG
jgi:hypothetical protein